MNTLSSGQSVPQWGRFQLCLNSCVMYPHPLQEVSLQAEFTSPSGKHYRVHGFWDGHRAWSVRFMPDEMGEWRYLTRCSNAQDGGLHAVEGRLVCEAPDQATAFARHGRLKLSSNRRYLVHADGTPFFWMGDTVWNGPLLATVEEWQHYLDVRMEQQFTAVQWVATQWISAPDGDRCGAPAFYGHDRIRLNPAYFRRLDGYMDAINAAGLLAAPVLLWAAQWGDPEIMAVNPGLTLPRDQAILLARYMVARWGAHHALWILPGDGEYLGPKAERWHAIGQAVFGDLPHALTTLHPCGLQSYHRDFASAEWLSVIGYQSCHFDDDEAVAWHVNGPPATCWRENPPRPVINLEPAYENILDMRNMPARRFDDEAVRRLLYWSLMLSPTAGVTYGGHGVWGWDDGTEPTLAHPMSGTPLPWRQALRMPGAEQVRHLMQVFGSLDWWRLQPAQEVLAEQPGQRDLRHSITAARSGEGDLCVAYTPSERRIALKAGTIGDLQSTQWFNPRDGSRQPAVPTRSRAGETIETPAPGDWLLVINH